MLARKRLYAESAGSFPTRCGALLRKCALKADAMSCRRATAFANKRLTYSFHAGKLCLARRRRGSAYRRRRLGFACGMYRQRAFCERNEGFLWPLCCSCGVPCFASCAAGHASAMSFRRTTRFISVENRPFGKRLIGLGKCNAGLPRREAKINDHTAFARILRIRAARRPGDGRRAHLTLSKPIPAMNEKRRRPRQRGGMLVEAGWTAVYRRF